MVYCVKMCVYIIYMLVPVWPIVFCFLFHTQSYLKTGTAILGSIWSVCVCVCVCVFFPLSCLDADVRLNAEGDKVGRSPVVIDYTLFPSVSKFSRVTLWRVTHTTCPPVSSALGESMKEAAAGPRNTRMVTQLHATTCRVIFSQSGAKWLPVVRVTTCEHHSWGLCCYIL